MNKPEMMHGFYSAEHHDAFCAYDTYDQVGPNGEIVTCWTEDREGAEYAWPDKRYVGYFDIATFHPVRRHVRLAKSVLPSEYTRIANLILHGVVPTNPAPSDIGTKLATAELARALASYFSRHRELWPPEIKRALENLEQTVRK
jgi:hypothetical protein